MMTGVRFWVMVLVLSSSALGLHLISHGEKVPPARPLAEMPAQVGAWQGRELPIETRVLDAVAVDDYVSRVYEASSAPAIGLYVGYYRSQRTGQTIHSPKNCLPGAGWQPVQSRRVELSLSGGRRVPVNLYIIEKGLDRQLILYWYQSHGRVIASEYWGKFYLVADALRMNRTDSALVRISTPVAGSIPDAQQRAVKFAEAIEPQVDQLIPR